MAVPVCARRHTPVADSSLWPWSSACPKGVAGRPLAAIAPCGVRTFLDARRHRDCPICPASVIVREDDTSLPTLAALTTLHPGPAQTGGGASILELTAIACARGTRQLFEDLDAHVGPGGLLRVSGPNGAGKTSLLRTISGLSRPEHGAIRWQGEDIRRLGENYSSQLIYIGHAPASKAELSVHENLAVSLALQGRRPAATQIDAALQAAGLSARRAVPAGLLSQGQRRRLALARLTVQPPAPLWILDEPFTALDATARGWLVGLIQDHLRGDGIVIFTSHDRTGLETLPQQVIEL